MTDGTFSEEQVLGLARRAYREGRAGFQIAPERCALLVIDMHLGFAGTLRGGAHR
jgi:hypothetical protein